jgi:hypothetical protein
MVNQEEILDRRLTFLNRQTERKKRKTRRTMLKTKMKNCLAIPVQTRTMMATTRTKRRKGGYLFPGLVVPKERFKKFPKLLWIEGGMMEMRLRVNDNHDDITMYA